jgi:hypothetical protein
MPLAPETSVTRTAKVLSCKWDEQQDAVILTVDCNGSILSLPVHPETGSRFYPGRVITLRLTV